jgi:hypothetical protein
MMGVHAIYLHVINIYLHNRLYTTKNKVYIVIYPCILPEAWYILSYTLVYSVLRIQRSIYLVYKRI